MSDDLLPVEAETPPPAALVEVNVTETCPHGCFGVYIGSTAIWRIAGIEPIEAEAESEFVFHQEDCGCEDEECWDTGGVEWDIDGWGD